MKKIIAILLALAMALALCACGAKPVEPTEEPAPVPSPSAAQEPEAPEVPASPEPAPSESETTLIGLLNDINENYRPGTAGSGMAGYKYAAMLLDWFEKYPNTDTVFGSAANFAAVTNTEDGELAAKLLTLWQNAVSLTFGQNMGELESVGYVPEADTWNTYNTHVLFETLYSGLSFELPALITVYYGDDNAEHLISTVYPTDRLDEYSVMGALKAVGAVNMDVGLNSFEAKERTLYIDVSKEFQTQLCSYGTSGEMILMGSVVRTYLEAFNSDEIVITVDGETLESGHEIYGYAISADHYDF